MPQPQIGRVGECYQYAAGHRDGDFDAAFRQGEGPYRHQAQSGGAKAQRPGRRVARVTTDQCDRCDRCREQQRPAVEAFGYDDERGHGRYRRQEDRQHETVNHAGRRSRHRRAVEPIHSVIPYRSHLATTTINTVMIHHIIQYEVGRWFKMRSRCYP